MIPFDPLIIIIEKQSLAQNDKSNYRSHYCCHKHCSCCRVLSCLGKRLSLCRYQIYNRLNRSVDQLQGYHQSKQRQADAPLSRCYPKYRSCYHYKYRDSAVYLDIALISDACKYALEGIAEAFVQRWFLCFFMLIPLVI